MVNNFFGSTVWSFAVWNFAKLEFSRFMNSPHNFAILNIRGLWIAPKCQEVLICLLVEMRDFSVLERHVRLTFIITLLIQMLKLNSYHMFSLAV